MTTKLFQTLTLLTALAASALFTIGAANSAEIKIIAPNAVKEAVVAIGARYSKDTDTKVSFTWSGSEAIAQRVGEGEVYDVVLTTSAGIDRLAAAGIRVRESGEPLKVTIGALACCSLSSGLRL